MAVPDSGVTPRTWTIYVCPECGWMHSENRDHPGDRRLCPGSSAPVEVVEAVPHARQVAEQISATLRAAAPLQRQPVARAAYLRCAEFVDGWVEETLGGDRG